MRSRSRLTALGLAAFFGPLLAGCGGALDPQGSRSAPIADLWWFLLIAATAVCVLVVVLLITAIVVGRRRNRVYDVVPRGLIGMIVGLGVVLPGVVILVLSVWSFTVDRQVLASEGDELVIEVTGHRFWWEVRYPESGAVTANEIVIPTGRAVRLQLVSEDVIHSFWVPELAGKADLIPGRTNQLYIEADEPGEYRGQCAEFCGIQHANMRVFVEAVQPDAFDAWLEDQAAPAETPADDEAFVLGQQVFGTAGCASCHTVRGQGATGDVGPDLTNVASRQTLAAGTLENTPGNMAAWILRPQSVKPGAQMPAIRLAQDELDALLHFLQELE